MSYKLTYFNFRGRGECIRLLFEATGTKYEENLIKFEDWPKYKSSTPWGQVPVLEVGDKTLAQTLTICRYLGRELKLNGESSFEIATADEYADAMNDLFTEWVKFLLEKNPEKKESIHAEVINNLVPKYLGKFEEIKAKVEGPYMIGNGKGLTWADVFLADKLDHFEVKEGPNFLEKYPNLKKFKDAVFSVPKIKAYIEKRPPA